MIFLLIGGYIVLDICSHAIWETHLFFRNKDTREEICHFKENYDALFTKGKNEMIKEFLKETLLPNIIKITKLLNELVIFKNKLLIKNGEEDMFYLGSDRNRSMLLDTLKEMENFIRKNIIFHTHLWDFSKTPIKYVKDSQEEFAKLKEGTGNLGKVIHYHICGIKKIAGDNNLYDKKEVFSRMYAEAENFSFNYFCGHCILKEIIETYEYIDYLVTPINDKLVIEEDGIINTFNLGYFDLLHMGMFVSKFNSHYRYIQAKYIYQDDENNILKDHMLIFESDKKFKFFKESTFRTILEFEIDIESSIENGKHIIRFNNVKQPHDFEKLRDNTRNSRLNMIIEKFNTFKGYFGFN